MQEAHKEQKLTGRLGVAWETGAGCPEKVREEMRMEGPVAVPALRGPWAVASPQSPVTSQWDGSIFPRSAE